MRAFDEKRRRRIFGPEFRQRGVYIFRLTTARRPLSVLRRTNKLTVGIVVSDNDRGNRNNHRHETYNVNRSYGIHRVSPPFVILVELTTDNLGADY